jgi:hypothetical protein
MNNKLRLALWLIIFCCLITGERFSPRAVKATGGAAPKPQASTAAPAPTPSLNQMKVGRCEVTGIDTNVETLSAKEGKRGLVMDARPFAINQAIGKLSFNGNTGRVTILHMNPFVYRYSITVAQKELVTTALDDFIKLLLPTTLGKAVGTESGNASPSGLRDERTSKLKRIEQRLDAFKASDCKASPDACAAITAMRDAFEAIKKKGLILQNGAAFNTIKSPKIDQSGASVSAKQVFIDYNSDITKLRDVEADAHTTCTSATTLNEKLGEYNFTAYFDRLDEAQKDISDVTTIAQDLENLIKTFREDKDLANSTPVPRCQGYNCVGQFEAYAQAALEVLTGYQTELNALRANAQEMQKMFDLTNQMQSKEGLFARTITVIKKFELSEATISLNRVDVGAADDKQEAGKSGRGTQSGTPGASGSGAAPRPVVTGGDSSDGAAPSNAGGNQLASGTDGNGASGGGAGDKKPANETAANGASNNLAPAGQIHEVVQIGRPRFTLSAGMVYSPLARRTFESVKGFKRDAQGNPTGDGSADVVGFGENSSRRLLPMVILNSRLANLNPVNLYFSVGVSAKHDDNVDVEYLFGPSVSLLNDRALITFGAYGGKTQNLVPDLRVGDELPDTLGDAKLFRKSYTWKPGLSFSYTFSRTTKKDAEAGGGSGGAGAASPADDLKNEIRIGNIPFNLALGLAYTSLEQRTFDAVAGFARDRQGNLTDGRTLTRIVGLTSSSSYRLTPLVLLHSRLTNFGSHDFYFTTGLTGKKTDNDFDIEYLLGGSINMYRRKAFLTFGTFAGKQQTLGGDFFEGAKLGKSQDVTTQNRYVWKPAFSFSYDITKIIQRKQ